MKWGKSAGKPLALCLALLGLTQLSACQTLGTHSKPSSAPLVRCEERAPVEQAPEVDATSESWRYWYQKFLEMAGIATAEAQKRASTAACLDALREAGVIR